MSKYNFSIVVKVVFEHETIDGILKINCLDSIYGFSVEDSDVIMSIVIDKILEIKKVERIILAERREYEYDFDQTRLIVEIANLYDKLLNQEKMLSFARLGNVEYAKYLSKDFQQLQFILQMIKRDPIGAYVKVRRLIRFYDAKVVSRKEPEPVRYAYKLFVKNILIPIKNSLEKTQLIQNVMDRIHGHVIGDRNLYREIFSPLIRPIFMLTRYVFMPPKGGRLVERYEIPGNIQVEIFRVPDKVRYFYYINAPEFRLSDVKYSILDNARRQLAEHKPSETEFTHPEKAREVFMNIGRDMIRQMSAETNLKFSAKELEELTNILVRHTAGFGILEILLADEKLQDIYVNSPIGITPIYVQHDDYEECETNLIPTREDAEGWATRFRLFSGRPLDEANPVLDTELLVPGGRARVAAITRTLSPEGIAYAFRRHRDRPWTYPLFLDVKYFNPLFAGLISFLVDGSRSILFAGGRSSGKTSLLGATILEIMKKFRIITVEDSVTGDCNILIERNGRIERTSVGNLIDDLLMKYGCEKSCEREILKENPENIRVFSIDSDGKVKLCKVSAFIRHKVNKKIYKVKTRLGRIIKITGDHSIFTFGNNGSIYPIRIKELKKGDFIATPRTLPFPEKGSLMSINLLDHLDMLPKKSFVIGSGIREFIEKNKKIVREVSTKCGYTIEKGYNYPKSTIQNWKKRNLLPCRVLNKLLDRGLHIDTDNLKIKTMSNSREIPIEIVLDNDFLTFVGLWIADGCYDKKSIIISVAEEENREIVRKIAQKFGLNVKMDSDGFSLMLNSSVLKTIMKYCLKLDGNAYTKKIPDWVFNLSQNQIASVLRGIFSGDGYLTRYEVGISLSSIDVLKDIQTLLLTFGIISRIGKFNEKDKTYNIRISTIKNLKKFSKKIGFLQKERMVKLNLMCSKKQIHDVTDVIPLSLETKKMLSNISYDFNVHDYIKRNNNIGREKFKHIIEALKCDGGESVNNIMKLSNSDIFWDQIKEIEECKDDFVYVYDFSVPEYENFVCENILAHNTLELPVIQLRNLGYNIERMKSRSVITRIEAELPADEALRTALRLGDSCLIVGEVRSVEAKALFEAMRIGALANVVAGTIHGESAYGVFDRVVNDLGVTRTSFKAIDAIVVSGMIKSADGLHRYRRVLDVTEVRKHWKEDPMDEKGFVNLMEYSAKEDKLKPTDTLLSGESFVINEIAKRVREWHGNWDAVWSNIELRGKIKQAMVDYAKKLNRRDILEAEWVSASNEIFHMISDEVRREIGSLDSDEIYRRWDDWFKGAIKGSK